jgi:MFS family permease
MTSPVPSALPPSGAAANSFWFAFLPLLPLMLTMFVGFLPMGMALPVVPRHVHDTLGQGTVMVGVVMGSQFVACLVGRLWSGGIADARGPRVSLLAGLVAAVAVGGFYLASLSFVEQPRVSVALLIVARLLVGIAESFIVTGALSWGVARLGPAHAGKVLGWMGVALFGAYAAGAPIGVALHAHFGFAGLAVAAVVVPLLVLVGAWFIQGVAPGTLPRPPFYRVIGAVKLPGAGLMLCAVGFAMISAFSVLLFAQRGWEGGALAVTSMGLGFIVSRLLFGHLPDQIGGARVTVFCALVEVAGLLLIWGATVPMVAWVGAALAGAGYGLGFQGFGVEAVRRAPAQSRGAAMGAYAAFQDISTMLAAPLGGVLAQVAGMEAVYLAAAVAALGAFGISLAMLRSEPAA